MQNLTLAQIEADPVPVIQHWLAEVPMLWWGGVADWRQIEGWPEGQLEENRAQTLASRGVGQLIRAAQFLDQPPRIKTLNRRHGTYGWKHAAERFHKARAPREDYYIGEGAFLIASLSMGLWVSQRVSGAYRIMLHVIPAVIKAPQAKGAMSDKRSSPHPRYHRPNAATPRLPQVKAAAMNPT